MAELNQQQVIDYIKGISVLELSQLVKALESELGVSAAAAMPMAMPGMAARRRRRRGGPGRGEDRVQRHPDRSRRGQDQGHQGRPRGHQPRPEGSQGPRRERAEAAQGRREQGRGRGDQEEVRRSRRQGRDQVSRRVRLGARDAGLAARSRVQRSRLMYGPGPDAVGPADVFRLPIRRGSVTDVQPSQERLPRTQGFLEDQDDGSDSEPDRDPAEIVRALPADEPPALRARGRRPAVGVQVGLPDQRLPRELVARVHRVFDRQLGVQVRQAGRPAPPAQALQELRRDADCRSATATTRCSARAAAWRTRRAATSATSAATRSG